MRPNEIGRRFFVDLHDHQIQVLEVLENQSAIQRAGIARVRLDLDSRVLMPLPALTWKPYQAEHFLSILLLLPQKIYEIVNWQAEHILLQQERVVFTVLLVHADDPLSLIGEQIDDGDVNPIGGGGENVQAIFTGDMMRAFRHRRSFELRYIKQGGWILLQTHSYSIIMLLNQQQFKTH